MLVLGRNVCEYVVVGGESPVLVCVVKAANDKARLGFTAAEDLPILRLEILPEMIGKELAVEVPPDDEVRCEEHRILTELRQLLVDPCSNATSIVTLLAHPVMVEFLTDFREPKTDTP